ncbi:MAG: hypothetical protein FWC41_11255 [Firmicutes bacterium]|nr:hypothetical protein [Bacillota bacterium]
MDVSNIVLYSTDCNRCKILEEKLKRSRILFNKSTDKNEMLKKGFTKVPILKVGQELFDFYNANQWINKVGANYEHKA